MGSLSNGLSKEAVLEQLKLVKTELNGVLQGYEQALGWILQRLDDKDTPKTVDTGTTQKVG